MARPLRVVVVGAGVGGLAVARGLLDDGHVVSVVEKAPTLRLGGAAVSVWFNGAAALRHLGVSLDGVGRRIDSLELRRPDGRVLAGFDAAALAERFGVEASTVPRRAVLERLAAGIPAGVIRFGCRCRTARPTERGAAVELDDGTVLDADLVIGADGWHSVVRDALGDAAPVRAVGVAAWQILAPMPAPLSSGHDFVYLVSRDRGPGRRAGFMPAGHGLLQAWFDVPRRPEQRRPDPVLPELRRTFSGWPTPVPEVLDAAVESDVELWHYVYRPVPEALGRARLALVGDAAHTMPPYLAQGANQALEDAWVLTTRLARARDPVDAVRAYSARRRRRTAMVGRLATSPLASGPLGWLDRLTPRSGLPRGLGTWFYAAFFRSISDALS